MKHFFSLLFFLQCILFSFSQSGENITLEDIYLNNAFPAYSSGYFKTLSDGKHFTEWELDDNGYCLITKQQIETGKTIDTLVSSKEMEKFFSKDVTCPIEDYTFSTNTEFVLFNGASEHVYRHSTKEPYYIWNRKNKTIQYIGNKDEKLMYGNLSPDEKKVSYVSKNNLFIQDIESGNTTQLTNDGKENEIINGATDWVYEEEFSFDMGYTWSPDAKKIAYYKFNESEVKEFSFDEYGTLYPHEYKFKYPKAGEKNSVVTIHIFDTQTGKTITVNTGAETDIYLPRIKWSPDSKILSVVRLNRLQNKLELLFANPLTGESHSVYTETSNTYVDMHEGKGDYIHFLLNGNFLLMSEKSGFNHIYLFNNNGKEIKQLTSGNWDVVSIEAIDEKSNALYFKSSEEGPLYKALYKIKMDGSNKKKLSTKKGSNSAQFIANNNYFVNTYSNANSPNSYTLHKADGKLIRTLEDNKNLKEKISKYAFGKKEFFSFTTTENILLNGWMIKPANFDASKRYPVFFTIYGGPGSQTVEDTWDRNFFWYQLLTQKGYIIVSVDNRGTGMRGRDFKNCTYKQLGKLETQDQIEAAKYLGTLPYVDKNRIGIFGWSYGGYMSSLCLLKGAEYFKMAIAVAPVTNWRYYDSIYTERFMDLPSNNGKNYDDNSPITHVDKLKGKYLLIHGTADDNVHFQNTVEMTNALINAGKQFDLFFYPDKNHSIGGRKARYHLYTQMTNYILTNL